MHTFTRIGVIFSFFILLVKTNEIVDNVLYAHSGLKSNIVLRELHDGIDPYQMKLNELEHPENINLVVNLDAIDYLLNDGAKKQSENESGNNKPDDKELIQLAQNYIPAHKLNAVTTSFIKNKVSELTNWASKYFAKTFKYIYQNFIFKIIKYSYFWAYQLTKYTVKLTGWYYGTSNLPIKCFIGLDWIDVDTQGRYLVGWETFTLNDNCAETVDQRALEIILAQAKIKAAENDEVNLCHFYKNEAGIDSGAWFANIRVLSVKEHLELGENIWDISCEEGKQSKRETLWEVLQKGVAVLL